MIISKETFLIGLMAIAMVCGFVYLLFANLTRKREVQLLSKEVQHVKLAIKINNGEEIKQ